MSFASQLRTLEEIQQQVRQPRDSHTRQLTAIREKLKQQKHRYQGLRHRRAGQDDLRLSFQSALQKLNELSTRDAGVAEAKGIIERNVSEVAFKVYLGCLGEISQLKNPGAREQDVLLLGHVSCVFAEKLVEEGPSPFKRIQKLLGVIQEFFKDLNRQVHEASARTWGLVYCCCFPKDALNECFFEVFYDPLELAMTSGVNIKAQQAAGVAIFQLVALMHEAGRTDVLQGFAGRLLPLFLRLRAEYPDLVSTLGVLIEALGLEQVFPDLFSVVSKLLSCLKFSGPQSQLLKIETCKLIQCVAKQLEGALDITFDSLHTDLLEELGETQREKLPAVQYAAKQAYQQWNALAAAQETLGENSIRTLQGMAKVKSTGWGTKKSSVNKQSPAKGPVRRHIEENFEDSLSPDHTQQELARAFEAAQAAMERQFSHIHSQLAAMDSRLDNAYNKVAGAKQTESRTPETDPPLDELSSVWLEALEALETCPNTAFSKVLSTGDDIYLLRLMHKTGPCIGLLSPELTKELINRLADILNSQFIEDLGVEWVANAIEHNSLGSLSQEDRAALKQAMGVIQATSEEHREVASSLSTQI